MILHRADSDKSELNTAGREHEWGVILAGGDGTRLKSLTRRIAGDERPKQFCSILGSNTLLEETRRRVTLEISSERTLYVVNLAHEPFYRSLLSSESKTNLVVQSRNRGTAPAILYSLLRIAATDPKALVAFFPSDHYISDDRKFMGHIRAAFDVSRQRPDLIILLGIQPESPEVEYGWIEPAEPISISGGFPVYGVRRFWEKPHLLRAQVLQLRGCLWNSFVIISSAQALLEIIQSALPELHREFATLSHLLGTSKEAPTINWLYERIKESNFSHRVLAMCPHRLAVTKVTGVRWNDLGEPKRVLASLNMAGVQPHWVEPSLTTTPQPVF